MPHADHQRRETTGAPATDRNARRIAPTVRSGGAYAGSDVLDVSGAPSPAQTLCVGAAVPGRPAWVRAQDHPPPTREVPQPAVPRNGGLTRRAAVHVDDHRRRRARSVGIGIPSVGVGRV